MSASHLVFSREDYAFSLVFGFIVLIGGMKRLITREEPTWFRGELVTRYTAKGEVIRGCVDILVGVAALILGSVNLF